MRVLIEKLTPAEREQIRRMVRRLHEQGEDTPQSPVMAVAIDEALALGDDE